jgi:Flp pilus assembly protein TadB
VSKDRAAARAQRAAFAAQRAEQARAAAAKASAERDRRERRALLWRRIRLWQHGAGFRRDRERWAALATIVLLALLLVYFLTRSLTAVFAAALFAVVGTPVLVLLIVDRSRK